MLTGERIVQFIFREENVSNYVVKHPRENPHWTRFIKWTSWCNYRPDGTITIYLEEKDEATVEAIYAAVHEVGHALNFRKHNHYALYMLRVRRLLMWSVLTIAISVGESLWKWNLHHLGILFCLFLSFSAYQYLQAYKMDETQVEILTIQMLRKHLERALDWSGDLRKLENLLSGISQETIRYHKRIQTNTKVILFFYLVLALGYCMKDLNLGQKLLALLGI